MEFLNQKSKDLVNVFTNNLLSTNRSFNYYVNWANVDGYKGFLVEIHAMDVLIGCKDESFKSQFFTLISKLPNVRLLFPFLFGLAKSEREQLYRGKNKLKIIQHELDSPDYLVYSFSKTIDLFDENSIEMYYDFFVKMGLKNLYQNIIEKSTLDYIAGVLVGMDSNGRKNRGGEAFELACQPLFENICCNCKYPLKLLVQKQFKGLSKYGFDISKDIANRKADFIVVDVEKKKAINFEVNFYNGSGSKPEEIIDSYITRQGNLKSSGIGFALVTDGKCWSTASNQLLKGFRHLDYLLNFYMLKHGMLEEILDNVFGEDND
ncbi:DpnII family type II restriction endonuclease [Bacteroides acidifaciens]|uniref:DpnII family type II restriction endonuclease n=1 Tax=Bacteroides acidifaciens TaxID=85831 RepID=UPI0025EA3CDB|nr:DpnII family type II restriction endonuclease [Bacteroides acidifaciens]